MLKKKSSFIIFAIFNTNISEQVKFKKKSFEIKKNIILKKKILKKKNIMIFNIFNKIIFNMTKLISNSAQILIQMQTHIKQLEK